MAGPYTLRMKFDNGTIVNGYVAGGNTVGTLIPVEINGGAVSTSEKSFKLKQGAVLRDLTTNVPDAAAGTPSAMLEIIADDDPKGKYLTLDASQSTTNTARYTPALEFRAGVTYKLSVKVAVPA